MATPAILAFSAAVPAKPNIQGEKNRIAPRIRFATSHNFAFVQFSMTPSIESSPARPKRKAAQTGSRPARRKFNETSGVGAGGNSATIGRRRCWAAFALLPLAAAAFGLKGREPYS
jgi:hypothetical protein